MATAATISGPQEEQLRSELKLVTTKSKPYFDAKAMVPAITDQASYDQAAMLLTEVKSFRKKWAEFWTPKKDSAYKTWKLLCDAFNEGDRPAERAESAIKAEILRWDMEQERIRLEAQRKADLEAQKAEEARRLQLQVQGEEDGITEEEIEAIMAAEPVSGPAPVAPTYQKAAGISKRDNWCVQITDFKALCKAIGTGKFKLSIEDTRRAVTFFEGLLKPQAVAAKSTLAIPGCKAENRQIVTGRSA